MLINVLQILNNVESWNFSNPELQFKGTESAIINKLIDLFTELKGFKFVIALILVFKKIENIDETNYSTFIRPQRLKQLLIIMVFIVYLNQSIVQL